MPKEKFSFTLQGVKYTDISGYKYSGSNTLSIGVAGTAQMVRQWLKQKYPNLPSKNYVWVQSESYSGGDSIRVYLNNAPEEFAKKLSLELKNFQEGNFDGMTDSYSYTKDAEKTSEGQIVNYGTKYLFVINKKPYDSDAPEVDWSVLSKTSAPAKTSFPRTNPTQKKSYPMGEVLKDCSGWTIYKKTLPDGRIVYNAKIKPETSPNKTDWNAIKGEIYTETGFKWGKFGAFERWGLISSEASVVDYLCKILGKYYQGGEKPAEPNMPEPETSAQPTSSTEEDLIEIYINGILTQEVQNREAAFEILSQDFGLDKFNVMVSAGMVFYNSEQKRLDVITDTYIYGEKWQVPLKYGNYLQFDLIDYGFQLSVSSNGNLQLFKGYYNLLLIDNGGEFNVERYDNNQFLGSVNYVLNDKPVTPKTLASLIREIYVDNFEVPKSDEKPAEVPSKSKEDIEKAIKGLQYLADKGNEKAIKAIKGLKYLLNK